MSANVYAVDAIEYRMLQSLKGTMKKLKRQKLSGLAEIERSHYLQGTFKQLCNSDQMKNLLYPGFSEEAIRQLPQNLVEILDWKELELDEEAYAKSGADVLKNIKLKGAKQGDFMDTETEEVLLPQIACEALAKGLVNAVQRQSRKISSMLAKTMKQVASTLDDRASRDQLDMEVVDMLMSKSFAIQQEYLGEEWLNILQNDIARFLAKERLAYVDEAGSAVVSSEETGIELQSRFQRMCWLEKDESIQERYPAIAELLDQLHALPFELNAKCATAGFQLLEASSGTTMFVYYPAGTAQILRLDSQVNKEGYDSGIRISCAYNISLPSSSNSKGDNPVKVSIDESAQLLFGQPGADNLETIPIVDDMLSIHFSTEVRNGRSMDASTPRISVIHFICGREMINT